MIIGLIYGGKNLLLYLYFKRILLILAGSVLLVSGKGFIMDVGSITNIIINEGVFLIRNASEEQLEPVSEKESVF